MHKGLEKAPRFCIKSRKNTMNTECFYLGMLENYISNIDIYTYSIGLPQALRREGLGED